MKGPKSALIVNGNLKTEANILLVITMGTRRGSKIIVKVVMGPFKGPKLPFIMC